MAHKHAGKKYNDDFKKTFNQSFFISTYDTCWGNCLNIVQTAKELLYISVVLSVL
ncbi:hypothetical protein PVE99_03590 [Priestia megaterium]|uniref:Uncharacterized protein n=1 Tax=Priestia megaterium TaxID=1404 RepID=A0ABD4WMS8_PRIMG|nr:hypothetical protein [Priestia megaterium]MDD9781489.1 hypothetical protein [Priestia megaterium]